MSVLLTTDHMSRHLILSPLAGSSHEPWQQSSSGRLLAKQIFQHYSIPTSVRCRALVPASISMINYPHAELRRSIFS